MFDPKRVILVIADNWPHWRRKSGSYHGERLFSLQINLSCMSANGTAKEEI